MADITGSLTLNWGILGASDITDDLTLEWPILDTVPPDDPFTGELSLSWTIFGAAIITLVLNGAPAGLTGTMSIAVTTVDGEPVYGPTTQLIAEEPPDSGRYVATVPEFEVGSYFAIWNDGTSQVVVSLLIETVQAKFAAAFRAVMPPIRLDGVPWTSVQIMEGAALSRKGPYIEIETVELDPVDTDPKHPHVRDITTTDANLTAGWYALTWIDDEGHQSMTDPEFLTSVIEVT